MWSVAYIWAQVAHAGHRLREGLLLKIDHYGFVLIFIVMASGGALVSLVSSWAVYSVIVPGLGLLMYILNFCSNLSTQPREYGLLGFLVPAEKELSPSFKLYSLAIAPLLGRVAVLFAENQFQEAH